METLALPYLKNFEAWKTNTRKHDMADALCFILFHINTVTERPLPPAVPVTSASVEPIENFIFKKSVPSIKNEYK